MTQQTSVYKNTEKGKNMNKKSNFETEYNNNKELVLTKYLGKNDDIVVVEDGIVEIGEFAFQGCVAKEIILPDSVKTIQQCAFASCKDLEKIILGRNLKYCDDEIILGSPVQEIVWTKPFMTTPDSDFLSLLYGLIREEDAVYYPQPEKKYDVFKRFFNTGKPQRTFLLTCNGKSIRLPRYIGNYLHMDTILNIVCNCLTEEDDMYYKYRYLHECLYDFQNVLSVVTEWYVLERLKYAKDYLKKHATLIMKRMTQDADDETLSLYINLGLLSDKDLQRALQWASEKNMQTSVAYILEQMRKKGLKNKIEMTL